jgi:hypothetical protein
LGRNHGSVPGTTAGRDVRRQLRLALSIVVLASCSVSGGREPSFRVRENSDRLRVLGATIEASIRKKGYVSGVEAQSLLDLKTGFRDVGFGLDVVDWLMEPGTDEAYRDWLPPALRYVFNTPVHGRIPKRSIEGPQICTTARELQPRLIRGTDFVAVTQSFRYTIAAPGRRPGSLWEQTIVFPAGKRYFISSDRITSANESPALFLRIDMPGHLKHTAGDTFTEIYLSYYGRIPSTEFLKDFAPDEKFLYRREAGKVPARFIRAYKLRDPETGREGPWLAGMTLQPDVVTEAWCHQRGYVSFIEEFGGRPIRPGESFSAAFIVGFFDTIGEMEEVYDRYAGNASLDADAAGWLLTPGSVPNHHLPR